METIEWLNRIAWFLWPSLLAGLGFSILWVILLGIAARAARKRSPSGENLVWRLALAGLAVAFAAPVARSLCPMPLQLPSVEMAVLSEPLTDRWVIPSAVQSSIALQSVAASRKATRSAMPQARSHASREADPELVPEPARRPIAGMLLAAWLLAVVWRSARLIGESRRWSRIRRAAVDAPDEVQTAASGLALRMWCRRKVTVMITPIVRTPLALGMRRPAILLPEIRRIEDLIPVLAHEMAHVTRGDLRVLLALRITQALLPFHPLLPLVARRLDETAEAACDDWVVQMVGDPAGYARTLVAWAERRAPALALAAPFPGGGLLRHRVGAILDAGRQRHLRVSRRAWVGGLAAVVLLAVGAGVVKLGYYPADVLAPPPELIVVNNQFPYPRHNEANAWDYYKFAVQMLRDTDVIERWNRAKVRQVTRWLDDPRTPLPEIAALADRARPALDTLRLGNTYKYGYYPERFGSDEEAGEYELLLLAHVMAAKARVAAARGDMDAALRGVMDMLQLGRILPRRAPTKIANCGYRAEYLGLAELADMVANMDAGTCRALAARLAALEGSRTPPESSYAMDHKNLRGDLWAEVQGWSRLTREERREMNLHPGPLGVLRIRWRAARHADVFREFDALWTEAVRQTYYPRWRRQWPSRPKTPLLHFQFEPNYNVMWLDDMVRARWRLLEAELALRAYRLEHGRECSRLTDLAPRYLPAVPQDPFGTGGPILYHTGTPGFVYSMGPDGDDDGGTMEPWRYAMHVSWPGVGISGDLAVRTGTRDRDILLNFEEIRICQELHARRKMGIKRPRGVH